MPRCPLAKAACDEQEPELVPTGEPGHAAACHFSASLIGRRADEVFAATAADASLPASYGAEIEGVTGHITAIPEQPKAEQAE